MLKKLGILLLIAFICISTISFARSSASRLDSDQQYEYVIVTPLQFAGIFQKLAEWKTEKGVPAKVVTTEFIKKNYTSGKLTFRIREFLRDAYKNWGTKWVLLGGDTEGKQGVLIPIVYARSAIDNTDIPSDLYYADLTGSWDGNSNGIMGELKDNVDLKAELYVGRASVDTEKEASDFVDKVLQYERKPPMNWVKTAVIAASELDENTFAERGAEELAKKYLKGFKIGKYYHLRGSNAAKFKAGLNTKNPHFVYVGAHGNQQHFGFNGSFSNDDADSLTNKYPFIYTSISCLTNYFDKDSLSEHIMNNPKSGAVAYWACSREGWYQPRNEGYFFSILMIKDFYNLLLNDPANVSNSIGMAATRARAKYIPEAKKKDAQFRWLVYGMNLLGDPEMPVWTSEPKKLSIKIVSKDFKKGQLGIRVSSNGKAISNARVSLKYLDDKFLMLTATAKNCIPVQIRVEAPNSAGVYSVSKTGQSGISVLSLKAKHTVVNTLINELIELDASVKALQQRLKKLRSNKTIFTKISRDYTYLENKLQKRQKEISKFFMNLVEDKKFTEIEATLDYIAVAFKANPKGAAQFGLILNSISNKISFSLAHLQGDPSGAQSRIFKKLLALKQQVPQGRNTPANQLGRIKVTSKPSGITVYLNNVPRGKTPCVIEHVPFGSHVIKLKGQGYKAVSSTLNIRAQKTVTKSFTMTAGCRIRGKVIFGNTGKGAKGAEISIIENVGGKWVTHAKKVLDNTGKYDFMGLPKKNVYADIILEGYNEVYKPFSYANRDQGYNRTWNTAIYPLAKLSGKIEKAAKSELRLFKKEKHSYAILHKFKISTSEFKLEGLPLGTYKLVYSVPGKNLCVQDFKITKGLDKKFNLKAPAIKTVHYFYSKIGEQFSKAEMKKNEKGLFSCSVDLTKGNYRSIFIVNFQDYKNGGPLTTVVNPTKHIKSIGGLVSNYFQVSKDQNFEAAWDSNKLPVYFAKEKHGENIVEVLTATIPEIKR